MPIIKVQFESSVTNANKDIFTRSYIEGSTSIMEFDTRLNKYRNEDGSKRKITWGKHYTVDINDLSPLYSPIKYRFILAKGSYYDSSGKRVFFTPTIEEVSTAQHMSKSVIRLVCYLAVICGVSLRNIATILTHLFLINTTKSSVERWINEVGNSLPSEEDILKKLMAIQMPLECNIDGYYPKGTDNCVMVIKDEFDRILITQEVESENKEDAKKFLQKIKALGIDIVHAFSDYSSSYVESIKEVFPNAKFQADHFHTVKNIWKHLKDAYLSFRRGINEKAHTIKSKKKMNDIEELSSMLWELRWLMLKKPCNLTDEEKIKIKNLETIDNSGFVKNFRSIIKNIVSLFDKSETELSAKQKFQRLKEKINSDNSKCYAKVIKFLEEHWEEAMQYLISDEKKSRASNSESGMRLLRRLEKNHDGIRSEVTRKHYIKIYQTIKYFNEDIAEFIMKPIPEG